MKKLVAVGLAGAMALSLTACGAKEEAAATTAAPAATEAAKEAATELIAGPGAIRATLKKYV